ncbi:MAG: hypothetical protein HY506_00880, partial [Candidatus Yanofskybacteria bacterium]|nr:hypothetical protein [Candidatus Yanofskybacteria bacterium]
MPGKKSVVPKVLVFFDECVVELERCSRGCARNHAILCRHRLNFGAVVLNGGGATRGFSDFRVTVRIFNVVKKNK